MKPVDLFPAEVALNDGRILPACRVRVESDGYARVWRWLNGEARLEFDAHVTLSDIIDETRHRDVIARGNVKAMHMVDGLGNGAGQIAFHAISGGCECGGAWNLRDKIDGVPRL
jgi:hypothetical protein